MDPPVSMEASACTQPTKVLNFVEEFDDIAKVEQSDNFKAAT